MDLNRKNVKALLGILFAVILFYLFVSRFDLIIHGFRYIFDVVFPIVLGCAIAFVINIPMRGFEKQIGKLNKKKWARIITKHKRSVAFLLTIVSIVGILAFVIVILTPQLVATAVSIPPAFMKNWERLVEWANGNEWIHENVVTKLDLENIEWKKIWDNIHSFVFSGAGTVLSLSMRFASSLLTGIINSVLAFFFAAYILFEKEQLAIQMKKMLYAFFNNEKAEQILRFSAMVSDTFSKFISAQCVEAVILGCMFFVSMLIFRFPYAMAISILIAVTALIPICGAFIGCAVAVFLIVMVSPVKALWFIVLFLVLQQIEENFIYPKVVGNSVGLPALWVLAAITIGGSVMGIVGMLIFVPIFSVIYVLLRETVAKRLKEKRIRVLNNGIVKMERKAKDNRNGGK